MNHWRNDESDDSLFIRDDEDDNDNDNNNNDDVDNTSAASSTSTTSHGQQQHAAATTRRRPRSGSNLSSSVTSSNHLSFAEHQEDLDETSPGRGYQQSQQQQQRHSFPHTSSCPQMPTSLSSSSSSSDENSSLPRQQHQSQQQSNENTNNNNAGGNNNDSSNIPAAADQERQILLLMLLAQVCALHDPTPRTFTVHVLELFERGILDRQSIHFLFDLGLVPSSHNNNNNNSNLLMAAPPAAAAAATTTTQPNETNNTEQQELAMVTMENAQQYFQVQRSLEASAIRSTLEQQEQQLQQRQQEREMRQAAKSAAGTAAASSPPQKPPAVTTVTSPTTSPTKQTPPPQQQQQQSAPRTLSWSAEHHPLSLSRYQREFDQVGNGPLAGGSFGQVFRATNKMDGRDYAIKRVNFAATGYSRESVQQVVREVQCLAVCDHPHVVRYYQSWLEPSWMTGSSSTGAGTGTMADGGDSKETTTSRQKLLEDITHMVEGTGGSENLSDDLEAYFIDTGASRRQHHHQKQHQHHRRFSFDASDNSSWVTNQDDFDEEYSEWTVEDQNRSKDDSFLQDLYRPGKRDRSTPRRQNRGVTSSDRQGHQGLKPHHQRQPKGRNKKKNQQNDSFSYQICLFIQMQLCHPRSLADWIRERNDHASSVATASPTARLEPAAVIFSQIVHGLGHIHSKGIIHRDLKPANVFCSVEGDGLRFKIGDFGLSKLIRSVSSSEASRRHHRHGHHHNLFLLQNGPIDEHSEGKESSSRNANGEPSWQDPLTAGIGTASYAAPEQVSTGSYGKEADIFSLGLMLLELVCSFSTEHERIQTFHDCRYRRSLPTAKHEQELFDEYPVLAESILQCTDPSPTKRPTAYQLRNINIMDRSSNISSSSLLKTGESYSTKEAASAAATVDNGGTEDAVMLYKPEAGDCAKVSMLKKRLAEKDEELKMSQHSLSEKDDVIASLRRQVQALELQQRRQSTAAAATTTTSATVAGHSSSSLPAMPPGKSTKGHFGSSDTDADSCVGPAASCSSSSSEEGL